MKWLSRNIKRTDYCDCNSPFLLYIIGNAGSFTYYKSMRF